MEEEKKQEPIQIEEEPTLKINLGRAIMYRLSGPLRRALKEQDEETLQQMLGTNYTDYMKLKRFNEENGIVL